MSDRATVEFLAGVPLLEGHGEADLVQLARVVRRRTVREGEILFRQGDAAREVLFVVDGALSIWLQQPGDRTVEVARAGPGQMLGEIALLDGQGHTMSVGVAESGTVLALGRWFFFNPIPDRVHGVFNPLLPGLEESLPWLASAAVLCAATLILFLYARRRLRRPETMIS